MKMSVKVLLPLKVLGENPSLYNCYSSGGPSHFLGCNIITPITDFVFTWPSSLCVSLCLLLFLGRHQTLDLGLTLNPGVFHLKILN